MKIAIYSRKSKFTGKGDSIENQVSMCKQYAYAHFEDISENSFYVYEDEGFTGSNIDRPQFKKFLNDAGTKKFDVLIVYRLDRVSRNVADFSNVFKDLESYGISFISIKENFDTSSPMGKAMLHISSVFAQLERDTIAERIKDSFDELAKTGRWLGGTPPYGYKSVKVDYEKAGKSRSYFILEPIEKELEVVKIIFEKYLYFLSLSMTFKYMNENGYKTRQGKRFTFQAIRDILQNPVYCIADEDIYTYYTKKNANIYADKSKFDGTVGLAVYNRTKTNGKSRQLHTNITDYTITTGFHKGIITGSDYIKVLNKFEANKGNSFSKQRTCPAVLSSLVFCGDCGSRMPGINGRMLKDGTQSFKYICTEKRITRKVNCQAENIDGYLLEELVLNKLLEVSHDLHSDFNKSINDINFKNKEEISSQQNLLAETEIKVKQINNQIENLVNLVSSDDFDVTSSKIFSEKISKLSKEKEELSNLIFNISSKINILGNEILDMDFIKKTYERFKDFHQFEQQEQINLLKLVIDKIIITGENIDIKLLYSLGDNSSSSVD